MPTLRRKKGHWYLRVRHAGQDREIATHCTDKKAAEAFQRQWERDAADPAGARRRAAESQTVHDALDLALARHTEDHAAGKIVAATLAFYARKIGVVVGTLGPTTPLAAVDAAAVDRYIRTRRGEKASDHTIYKELAELEFALKVARRAGWWAGVVEDVMPARFGPNYKPRDRALAVADVWRVIDYFCTKQKGDYRRVRPDRAAWVALAAGAGAELGALQQAARGDYDEAAGLVRVRGSKNEYRDRTVPVVLPASVALVRFAFAHGEGTEGKLLRPWHMNWRDLQLAAKAVKIPPFSLHSLRHSYGTWLLAAGLPYDDVAKALGHADTTMLHRVYEHLTGAELRARFAHLLAGAGGPASSPDVPRDPARGARGAHEAHTDGPAESGEDSRV